MPREQAKACRAHMHCAGAIKSFMRHAYAREAKEEIRKMRHCCSELMRDATYALETGVMAA